MGTMTAAVETLTSRCISGITANEEVCREGVESSIGLVTALVPVLGYERASEVASEALASGKTVREILQDAGDLEPGEIDRWLSVEAMTQPRRPGE